MIALLGTQTAGIILSLLLLAAWPPVRGDMLLVPVTEAGARRLAAHAIDHGARLVAEGPLPASLVVSGDRARLAGPMLDQGVLILAASIAGCGEIV